ncbi:MAG: hypothetical protein AAF790_15300 [Planctomycetota bacterium]
MPKWTDEEKALLGTDTDAAIGEKIGRNQHAVTVQRTKLGIPAFQTRTYEWSAKEDARLGMASDAAIADELGVSRPTVLKRRQALGIPSFRSQQK